MNRPSVGVVTEGRMSREHSRLRAFAGVSALIGWVALGLQLYLSMRLGVTNGVGMAGGIASFLGYFTILTNNLAAVALTAPIVAPRSSLGQFFARPGVVSAIAASIAVVGIVYSLLLRHTWNPQGAQLVADRLLHDVMPILFIGYWWLSVPKGSVRWADIPRWCVYPIAYLSYALVRGALTGFYPYPFIDVPNLGYARAALNAAVILIGFSAVAAVFVPSTEARRIRQKSRSSSS
jgi:hypothetical protein